MVHLNKFSEWALAAFVVFVFVLSNSLVTYAIERYQATDALGQLSDSEINSPFFERSTKNNGHDDDDFGFDYALLSGTASSSDVDIINHRLFVADTSDGRVLVYNLDEDDMLIDRIADNVIGQSSFDTQSFSINQNTLTSPTAVVYDDQNSRLFVADGSRVLVFDISLELANGIDATAVIGQGSFSGQDSRANGGRFGGTIGGMDLDSATNFLYVSDTVNNRVMVFDVAPTNLLETDSQALYVLGQGCGDGQEGVTCGYEPDNIFTQSEPLSTPYGMNGPKGVAVDQNRSQLFVADYNNNRIMFFSISGLMSGMDESAEFYAGAEPIGLEIEPKSARLFVSDTTSTISIFDAREPGAPSFTMCGQETFGIANGMPPSCFINTVSALPIGVISDLTMNSNTQGLYVGSNYTIFPIFNAFRDDLDLGQGGEELDRLGPLAPDGAPDYDAGTSTGLTDHVPVIVSYPNQYGFDTPHGVVVDTVEHHLFVSDTNNNRVLIFNLTADNSLEDHTADYVIGQSDLESNVAPTVASDQTLHHPMGMAVDTVHNFLYVADAGENRVLAYDLSLIFSGLGGASTSISAQYVIGQPDFETEDARGTFDGLTNPTAVAIDGTPQVSGEVRLFIADTDNNRVTVYDFSTPTNGPGAAYAIGQVTLIETDCEDVDASHICTPNGLLYVPETNMLYVSEFAKPDKQDPHNRVLGFEIPQSNGSTPFEGFTHGMPATEVYGQTDLTSSDLANSGSNHGLLNPFGMAYDADTDRLFVADNYQDRIMVFNRGEEDAIAMIGQDSYQTYFLDVGNPVPHLDVSDSSIASPTGLAFDKDNHRLYAVDTANNRVMIFNFVKITTEDMPDVAEGVEYNQTIETEFDQGTISFEVVSGSLPPGLELSGNEITGTPTTAGVYSFRVKAIDTIETGEFVSAPHSYTINVTESEDEEDTPDDDTPPPPVGSGGPSSAPGATGTHTPPSTGGTTAGSTTHLPACSDGIDNDRDARTDYPWDAGCDTPADNSEINTIPPSNACADGKDNDKDGLIDFGIGPTNDPGCISASDQSEYNAIIVLPPQCSNRLDDDVDGFVDMQDGDCESPLDDDESAPVPASPCIDSVWDGTTCISEGEVLSGTNDSSGSGATSRGNAGGFFLRTLGLAGLLGGLGMGLGAFLFSGPFTASELLFVPLRILALIGLWKRRAPWGKVFDSTTGKPLDPAVVTLFSKTGEEIARVLTDREGRYGFKTLPGRYVLKVEKIHYHFPSSYTDKEHPENNGTLYHGESFEIKTRGEKMTKDIPLDPIKVQKKKA